MRPLAQLHRKTRRLWVIGIACVAVACSLTGCGGGAVIGTVSTAPSITSISPNAGPTSGGFNVALVGNNFKAGAAVVFGGVNATSITVLNATNMTVIAPPHPAGAVDIKVTNPDNQTATKTLAFTYLLAPTISGVSPSSGSSLGGTAVAITGANFQAGATVSFGGVAAPSVTVSGPTKIQTTTPAHSAGTVDVTVMNPDGSMGTLSRAFTFSQPTACTGGPPSYPCSRTDLTTVQLPATIPNVGDLVGANTIVTDPDFKNDIVRVTEAQTNPSKPNESYFTTNSGSGDQNLWNSNSTLFTLTDNGGEMYVFSFDTAAKQASRLYVSNFPSENGFTLQSESGWWSRTQTNLLFFSLATGNPAIKSIDFTNRTTPPAKTTVYDFITSSPNCLGASFQNAVTWSSDLAVSADDQVFGIAYSTTGGQGTGVTAAVYKVGSGCRWYNTQTGQIGGDGVTTGTIGIPDRYSIHNIRLSRDGNWMVISITTCFNTCGPGVYFWQVGTTNVVHCSNFCDGHFTEGYTHWLNNSTHQSQAQESIRPFSAPGSFTDLIPLTSIPSGLAAPLDTHQSWNNNTDTSDSSIPFFQTTYSPSTPFPAAWYNEILGVAANGSGTTWRFAHSFITTKSQFFDAQYGIGSVSQDGKFFIFTSDWQGTLGSSSGAGTCTIGKDCRADVFIVELK